MEWIRENWLEALIGLVMIAVMTAIVVAVINAKNECEANGGHWRAKPAGCVEQTK